MLKNLLQEGLTLHRLWSRISLDRIFASNQMQSRTPSPGTDDATAQSVCQGKAEAMMSKWKNDPERKSPTYCSENDYFGGRYGWGQTFNILVTSIS